VRLLLTLLLLTLLLAADAVAPADDATDAVAADDVADSALLLTQIGVSAVAVARARHVYILSTEFTVFFYQNNQIK